MQTYTYHPKPSYSVGPARSSSLRSDSAVPYYSPKYYRLNSLDQNSVAETVQEPEELEIISQKTTTHIDAAGNTVSITTETIKALPDGSNIVEKETNYLRPKSRCGSRLSSSLGKTNERYNMSKIEEELNNFAYSYLDQSPQQPTVASRDDFHPQEKSDMEYNAGLRLASILSTGSMAPTGSDIRSNSIVSSGPGSTQKTQLKPILKKGSSQKFSQGNEQRSNSMVSEQSYTKTSNSRSPNLRTQSDVEFSDRYDQNPVNNESTRNEVGSLKDEIGIGVDLFPVPKIKFDFPDSVSEENLGGSLTSTYKGLKSPSKYPKVVGRKEKENQYPNHFRKFKTYSLRGTSAKATKSGDVGHDSKDTTDQSKEDSLSCTEKALHSRKHSSYTDENMEHPLDNHVQRNQKVAESHHLFLQNDQHEHENGLLTLIESPTMEEIAALEHGNGTTIDNHISSTISKSSTRDEIFLDSDDLVQHSNARMASGLNDNNSNVSPPTVFLLEDDAHANVKEEQVDRKKLEGRFKAFFRKFSK